MANKSRKKAHSSSTNESVHTTCPDNETPTRAPRHTAPSEELYLPRINNDGTVGSSQRRYEDGISRIARGYESPFGDNVPPVASQVPASTQGFATQPTPSLLSLSLLSPAMLKAIDTAVETAVEKGLKTIQEESIKMMYDLFKKMADLENEKATEFKKWFDERLAGMDSRIQRNERVVRGTDNDQTRDIAGDEDAGATIGDSLAPVGGGSSQSHKPSLRERVSRFFR